MKEGDRPMAWERGTEGERGEERGERERNYAVC